MPLYEVDIRGQRYEVEAPDDASLSQAVQQIAKQPQHFELQPPQANARSDSGILAGLSSAVEGMPIVGPALQSGVENTAAFLGSMMTGDPQAQVRQQMGGRVDSAQQANPGISTAAGIGGAVLGTMPAVLAAPGAFGAGTGPLLGRMLASGATGAAMGGADAAVRSGGDMEATKSGALWGAGLGAAGPAVGAAVGKGVGAIASRFGGGASKAQRAIGRAASADAVDDIGARLGQMGPDAMPMDLGPNLQRQAAALAATPGRGQEVIRSAVADRQGQAGSRIAGALDDALGQSVDTMAVADDIIAKRSAAAKPLYDAAYSKPIKMTSEMGELMKRPAVKAALKKAQKLAADEGLATKPFFQIKEGGEVVFTADPDVRQLDLTKRALDDMISTAQRAGENNVARILTQTKDQFVKLIDDVVPEYKQARAAFSGPSAVLDAMEEGKKAFSSSMTPGQLRTQLLKMGEAEKEAFVQGARAEIAKIMGTARNDALSARTTFMKGWNKEKLQILVGEEQAKKMLQSLDAEAAFTKTRDVVTGNSETAARLAAQNDIGAGATQPGIIRNVMNMRFGDAMAEAGDRVIGGVRNAVQGQANEELAQMLTSRDPQAMTRTIQMVQAAQKRGDITAQRAKEIIQGLSLGSPNQVRERVGLPMP